jgi:homoaconitase/3-isopropylmalate dehydratase large subunit
MSDEILSVTALPGLRHAHHAGLRDDEQVVFVLDHAAPANRRARAPDADQRNSGRRRRVGQAVYGYLAL